MSLKNLAIKALVGLGLLTSIMASGLLGPRSQHGASQRFIVQGQDLATVTAAVDRLGAEITHELGIIHAVGARLSRSQLAELQAENRALRIYPDRTVEVSSPSKKFATYTEFPTLVRADQVHDQGITGLGVTVAILDTGFSKIWPLVEDSSGRDRVVAHYDAIADHNLSVRRNSDKSGHGTHVSGIALNSSRDEQGRFNGIAPDADLVVVKAFGDDGRATYADVIRGLDWIVDAESTYGIRVLNLSFSAPPRSHYWDDPLNQAVMRAWQAGIVVVAAAGNTGPDPMTVGVPGNVPYVITVGAMTDNYTPEDGSDDFLASFSAVGPTAEGFIKPEMVTPGGHIRSLIRPGSSFPRQFRQYRDGPFHFIMSGTSQATAVVSGTAALLLQSEPWLQPDEVKCRLLTAARPAVDAQGNLAYSPLQQGAGLADAWAAISPDDSLILPSTSCANGGLDIDRDVAGGEHYAGPVRIDDQGQFYLEGLGYEWDGVYNDGGFLWTGGNPWIDASLWSSGNPWIDASAWSTGNPWIDASGNPWIDASGNPWIDASSWWNSSVMWSNGLSESMAINIWVDQE